MSTKFNTIMPESDDSCLCIQIERKISSEGYKENFIKRIEKMLAVYGEVRLLIYYKSFAGWDKEAAMLDFSFGTRFENKLYKMALVNPPDSEIERGLSRPDHLKEKIRLFEEHELEEALIWVKA